MLPKSAKITKRLLIAAVSLTCQAAGMPHARAADMHALVDNAINASPDGYQLLVPANQSVDLDTPTAIICNNTAGCTVQVEIEVSAKSNMGTESTLFYSSYVDWVAMPGSNMGITMLDSAGDPAIGTWSMSTHVAMGTHYIVSKIAATTQSFLYYFQTVYHVYKA